VPLLKTRRLILNTAIVLAVLILLFSKTIYPEQNTFIKKETALAFSLVLAMAYAFELFCCIVTKTAVVLSNEVERDSDPKSFTTMVVVNLCFVVFLLSVSISCT
jgi:uncharacterized BrkB/YihY/UPF0761 family membrane protein